MPKNSFPKHILDPLQKSILPKNNVKIKAEWEAKLKSREKVIKEIEAGVVENCTFSTMQF